MIKIVVGLNEITRICKWGWIKRRIMIVILNHFIVLYFFIINFEIFIVNFKWQFLEKTE